MPINFPSSASVDDTYTYLGKTWKWNGTAWERSAATETGNTEGNTGEVAYYSGKGSIIAGATAFFYDGDKVGIGTSGPTETLDVRGGITASGLIYTASGVSSGGPIYASSAGDVVLTLNADTDNSGENDNPLIKFTQDGGSNVLNMGMIGDAGTLFTGSKSNAFYIQGKGSLPIQFANDGVVRQTIHHTTGITELYYGLSADAGATFGSDINIGRNSINAGSGSTIKDQSGNPIFKVIGDRYIEMGDTDASGNDTSINIRDVSGVIQMDADEIGLNADVVKVGSAAAGEIKHKTDADTKIVFYGSGVPNKIDFIAGGVTFAGSILNNSVQTLHAPMGITVGHASGGALGAGNIYTPYGITCGALEVGGYWAGEQSTMIGVAVNNGSQVLTAGKKGHRIIPWDCEVIEWTVSSTDTGNITWDVNWCSYSDWPSTASVGGLGLPSMSSAAKATDTSVNWTKTTFSEGDIMEFEIDGTPTVTNSILFIKIRRTG